MVNGSECHGKQRQGGKLDFNLDFNELCVCKYHSSCYFNACDNSWNDVNIPYGHAPLPNSDDLLYSNNFSISYAHL